MVIGSSRNMVITKLDRRHKFASSIFEYMICFKKISWYSSQDKGVVGFVEAQKWFTENYGFSTEIDLLAVLHNTKNFSQSVEMPNYLKETKWAYSTSPNRVGLRIYTNEAELSFFYLTFSG